MDARELQGVSWFGGGTGRSWRLVFLSDGLLFCQKRLKHVSDKFLVKFVQGMFSETSYLEPSTSESENSVTMAITKQVLLCQGVPELSVLGPVHFILFLLRICDSDWLSTAQQVLSQLLPASRNIHEAN